MSFADYKEYFEQAAGEEARRLSTMSPAYLLDRIRMRRFDPYYQLWYSVGDKCDLSSAGWILFRVLRSRISYLNRYHCATVLLRLMGKTDLQASHLTVPHQEPERHLDEVRSELEMRIGPAPSFRHPLIEFMWRWGRRLTGR